MNLIVGIDPGKTGAIAHFTSSMHVTTMPATVHDIRDYFSSLKLIMEAGDTIEVFLEAVHSMPGQGVSSCFTFGKGVGHLEGIMAAMLIPYTTVTPQKWQKHFSLPKSKEFATKTLWKAHLREVALKRWPSMQIKREQGDAVLIATYGIDARGKDI
jgi:hypothetical protein